MLLPGDIMRPLPGVLPPANRIMRQSSTCEETDFRESASTAKRFEPTARALPFLSFQASPAGQTQHFPDMAEPNRWGARISSSKVQSPRLSETSEISDFKSEISKPAPLSWQQRNSCSGADQTRLATSDQRLPAARTVRLSQFSRPHLPSQRTKPSMASYSASPSAS